MVRVLAVADEVSDAPRGKAQALAPDLVLAAGDLPWDYLEYLASVLNRPVVPVPGNHDPAVDTPRLGATAIRNVIPYRLIEITPARAPALVGGPCAP